MLSSLLVSLLLGAPVDQRQLHRADADLYVEMADARAAWTAMQSAPLVSMVSGEPMAKLDKFGQQMGWNLRAAMDGLLPQADATRPDDRFWPWSAASSMSMSLSGLEPAGGDMRGLMVADFAEEAAAEQALRAMGSLVATDARPETVRLFEQDLPVARYKADAMQTRLAGWAVRSGARIVAGVGSMEPADLLALAPESSMAAHPARLDDDGLGARSGTLVYRAWSDLEAVGAPEFGALSGVLELQKWAAGFLPFVGSRGKWRLELDGARFATESLVERIGPAKELDALMGAEPVGAVATAMVPVEAVGAWTTSLAPEALEPLFDRLLGLPAATEQPGALSKTLDKPCAIYLLPYPALMQAVQAPPRVVVAMRTLDREAFIKAMDAKAAAVLQADPRQRVDSKPYRRQPMWVFAAEEEAQPAEAATPQAGPFGAIGAVDLTMRPTVALHGDRVLVALSPTTARSEVKRLIDEKEGSAPHAIASLRKEGAFELSTMDWSRLLGGLWDQARGLVPMLAQGGAEPVDLSLLPTSTDLFGSLQPTLSWSRRVPRDGAPSLVHARSESSFGPETPLMLAGMVYAGASSRQEVPGEAEVLETKPAPQPASQPAVDDAQARTTKALRGVKTALAVYKSQAGRFPAALDELLRGTDAFPDGFLPDKRLPSDAWSRPFIYEPATDGTSYALRSTGADGVDQRGAGDDIKAP